VFADIRVVAVDEDRVSYTWRDVTDRHDAQARLAESEERFRLLAENMADIVALARDGVLVWVSPSVSPALGWRPDELVGADPFALIHPDDLLDVSRSWQETGAGALDRLRYRVRRKDGEYHWVDGEGSAVHAAGDASVTLVLSARIVDAEVAALAALEDQAQHDELTGLMNRHAVFDHLRRMLRGGTRSGTRVALVFCDLDGFKGINDEHGHSAGDSLLRSIAARVEGAVRAGDMVARIGGDELLVVLNGVHDLDDAIRIAEKIRMAVALPTEVAGAPVGVSASIGVTLAAPGESIDAVVARADAAMYEAKRQGKDSVVAGAD
jgi:diguanylate cyclase (GGDEF)-like protein/PAS domain S-box-containing protein